MPSITNCYLTLTTLKKNCKVCLAKWKKNMKVSKTFSPLVLIALLCGCTDTKQKEVGQYVYIDCFSTVHTDRECASSLAENPKNKEERMANMQGVSFVDTCNLNPTSGTFPLKFCPKCVDDSAYKHLSDIIHRNTEKPKAY